MGGCPNSVRNTGHLLSRAIIVLPAAVAQACSANFKPWTGLSLALFSVAVNIALGIACESCFSPSAVHAMRAACLDKSRLAGKPYFNLCCAEDLLRRFIHLLFHYALMLLRLESVSQLCSRSTDVHQRLLHASFTVLIRFAPRMRECFASAWKSGEILLMFTRTRASATSNSGE